MHSGRKSWETGSFQLDICLSTLDIVLAAGWLTTHACIGSTTRSILYTGPALLKLAVFLWKARGIVYYLYVFGCKWSLTNNRRGEGMGGEVNWRLKYNLVPMIA